LKSTNLVEQLDELVQNTPLKVDDSSAGVVGVGVVVVVDQLYQL
jgi:hypothetical protein